VRNECSAADSSQLASKDERHMISEQDIDHVKNTCTVLMAENNGEREIPLSDEVREWYPTSQVCEFLQFLACGNTKAFLADDFSTTLIVERGVERDVHLSAKCQ